MWAVSVGLRQNFTKDFMPELIETTFPEKGFRAEKRGRASHEKLAAGGRRDFPRGSKWGDSPERAILLLPELVEVLLMNLESCLDHVSYQPSVLSLCSLRLAVLRETGGREGAHSQRHLPGPPPVLSSKCIVCFPLLL